MGASPTATGLPLIEQIEEHQYDEDDESPPRRPRRPGALRQERQHGERTLAGRSPARQDMWSLGRIDHDLPLRPRATRQPARPARGVFGHRPIAARALHALLAEQTRAESLS